MTYLQKKFNGVIASTCLTLKITEFLVNININETINITSKMHFGVVNHPARKILHLKEIKKKASQEDVIASFAAMSPRVLVVMGVV